MAFLDDLAKQLSSVEALNRIGSFAVSAIQKKIHGGKFEPNSPLTLSVKSKGKSASPLSDGGTLKASISHRVANGSVFIGTNHPGARINNYGGEIKARKTWLFIPASSHTRTLFRRYGWSVKAVCDGLRADGFAVWRQGRAIFYRRKGEGSARRKSTMIFILKKSVRIPKREFMRLDGDEVDALLGILAGRNGGG